MKYMFYITLWDDVMGEEGATIYRDTRPRTKLGADKQGCKVSMLLLNIMPYMSKYKALKVFSMVI